MSKRHYTAAIIGQGLRSNLRKAFASRFSSIRAIIMIPSESEKLELTVTRNARADTDTVTLIRTNWRTGETSDLYIGDVMGGKLRRGRLPRD